mmetsp:Transcript_21260/g.39674  ORF Transcript_21260/g.39674 Transcript_21260/m.39674 type:complete len:498 (+) Transcript_21260:117-1610(+)
MTMCSLSEAGSPRRRARACSLLKGEIEEKEVEQQQPNEMQNGTCWSPQLEQEEPSTTTSPSSITTVSEASHPPLSSSAEGSSRPSIPASVPFAKTFTITESYRKKPAEQARSTTPSSTTSTGAATTALDRPLRRRARSSEGVMLRIRSEEFLTPREDDAHPVVEFSLLASSSPQHFFTPLNSSLATEIRQRKKTKKNHRSSDASYVKRQKQQQSLHHSYYRPKSRWVIPIEHPFKVIWDVLTVILSMAHAYYTHVAIRDRKFGATPFFAFCDAWFLVDILLNFFTERKTNTGEVLSDHRSIVARYLTSWFAVDALSLFPWESLYMQPLIEIQNRRGILKKSFFRSKAVVRVTRHLRGKHFRWFGTVAKHTKQHGIGGQRLLRLIIKYVPKYFMFLRNMKGIVVMRSLRFVHWLRRFIINMRSRGNETIAGVAGSPRTQKSDASTKSLTTRDEDDLLGEDDSLGDAASDDSLRNKSIEVVYDDWELFREDDDDDGVPL